MSCCHGIGATETSKSIRQPEYLSDRYAVFTGCLPLTFCAWYYFGPVVGAHRLIQLPNVAAIHANPSSYKPAPHTSKS